MFQGPVDKTHDRTTVVITAEWIVPVTGEPLTHGAVAVRDGIIAAVGPANTIRKSCPRAEVLDLGHSLLAPGLVNCHAHLEYTLLKGLFDAMDFDQWLAALTAVSRRLTREELSLSARQGVVEAIRAGITCIGDCTPSGVSVEAMGEVGLRGVIFQELFGTRPEEAAGKVEEGLGRLAGWPTSRYPRLKVGLAPHAPYSAGPKLLQDAAAAATAHNLPLCLHLAESASEMSLRVPGRSGPPPCMAGLRPVPYAASLGILSPRLLAVHCVQVNREEAAVLAQSGVKVAHCPRSNATLGHGIAPLNLLQEAGVVAGLGTDSAVSAGNLSILEETRAAVWLQRASRRDGKVLGTAEALRMATIEGARALGLESEIGSLEAGKQADLVAFDLSGLRPGIVNDPTSCLVYHLGPQDVKLVMVGGEILLWNGALRSGDTEIPPEEGTEFARRLASLLP